MKPVSDINTPDMSAFWMPFTANQQFKAAPRILKSAEGMYYHSEDARAGSAAALAALGHRRAGAGDPADRAGRLGQFQLCRRGVC